MAYNTSGPAPSYLQSNPWSADQSYLGKLPGMFDTSALTGAYQQMNQQTLGNAGAMAAAATNAYLNRARQSGASQLGAGFAQAGAMLPAYSQVAQNNADLFGKQLQYSTAQAQLGAGLSNDIGQLQTQHANTLQDYYLNQQKLAQSQSQFGQDLGFRQQQLAQNQLQFGDTFGLQQRQLNSQTSYQQGQLANQRLSLAAQYQKQNPFMASYSTNLDGSPMSPIDGQAMARANQNFTSSQNLMSALGGRGGAGSFTGGGGGGSVGFGGYAPQGGGGAYTPNYSGDFSQGSINNALGSAAFGGF